MSIVTTKDEYLNFFITNNIKNKDDFYNYLIRISGEKLALNDLKCKRILPIINSNYVNYEYLNFKYLENKDFDVDEVVNIENIFNIEAINNSNYYSLDELLEDLLNIYFNPNKFNHIDFHNKWDLLHTRILDQFIEYDSSKKVYNEVGIRITYENENNRIYIQDGRHRCTCSLILNAKYIKIFNYMKYFNL